MHSNLVLASLLILGFTLPMFAQKGKAPAAPVAAAAPAAGESSDSESKIKKSAFRIQIGLLSGLQTNAIQSNSYLQDDVTTMNTSVNALNQSASSSSPVATISNQSAVAYSVAAGVSLQTIFFDFIRVRGHVTYDAPITMTNQYSSLASGRDIKYSSEVRVTQIQAPLLFMLDIPISKENTLYIGGGPTLYWGRIEKGISEVGAASGTGAVAYGKTDLDRIEGIAYGPTFIIGVQRRMGSLFSLNADIMYQSGARGGFVDQLQNVSSDKPDGFSDLSGNNGAEKYTNTGEFNKGAPKIMNFEGIRFLVGLNIHLDF